MDLLVMAAIVLVVSAGISMLAYLKRIAAAVERMADALEARSGSSVREDGHP
ncbi:hypothetical protein [Kitasatospora herbaricolor]|uniref:hypothetical protein n=1 Tax=Kitasatospora herbaricolor TaxID=68217 RepID=UPI0036DEA384